jgi:hypothetical protein
MARLDAERVGAWRGLQAVVGQIERGLDEELRAQWDIRLGWFDVLASLQRLGGTARPLDIAADLRAVEVELTRTGRRLWREMNVSYRRALQAQFAIYLADRDIADIRRILDLLVGLEPDVHDVPGTS